MAFLTCGHPPQTAEETPILLGLWESVYEAPFSKILNKSLYVAFAFAVREFSLRFFFLVFVTSTKFGYESQECIHHYFALYFEIILNYVSPGNSSAEGTLRV